MAAERDFQAFPRSLRGEAVVYPESGAGTPGHGFPKADRLLKRRQFLAMSDRGSAPEMKIRAGVFLVIGRANGLERRRLGVTASKKTGAAVTRNLIKRLTRELFRLHQRQWPSGLDYLFIARPEAGERDREALRADLALAHKKIMAWPGPKSPVAPRREAREKRPETPAAMEPVYLEPLQSAQKFVMELPGLLALGLIRIYQRCISPWLPPACRFWPTCSNYAVMAIKIHGFWRGSLLTAWRLLKCHPFHPGGYDPVPPGSKPSR